MNLTATFRVKKTIDKTPRRRFFAICKQCNIIPTINHSTDNYFYYTVTGHKNHLVWIAVLSHSTYKTEEEYQQLAKARQISLLHIYGGVLPSYHV